ncbi:hypothetical protein BXT84_12560 [Sulfobacillus thermotolerans]|uniref:Rhodanese domain-containing protein n=1 Tax=Sulfobacillus thermotolerans TaxID=338644 RepID=A0ABM6RW58_9FIRM|nr:hypothetical protein BXT84_12560 [Sulfobacillus thermotolerans]
MTPSEVLELLAQGEKIVILDVRMQHEYRQGHIKGAQLIPLSELPKRTHELRNNATIVTVCHTGRRSAQAARLLRAQGFVARNMVGGMTKWTGRVVK